VRVGVTRESAGKRRRGVRGVRATKDVNRGAVQDPAVPSGAPSPRDEILAVEDGTGGAGAALARLTPTRVVHKPTEARTLVRNARAWAGLVVAEQVGRSSGLDLLAAALERHPETPALVVADELTPSVLSRAHALGVSVLCGPVGTTDLRAFVRRVR